MKIGIIGGGQLGMMLCESAQKMGHQVIILDPTKDSPAGLIAEKQIVANFNDQNAIRELVSVSDVVTYEFENINYKFIEKMDMTKIPQGHRPLELSQHRFTEKENAKKCGLTVNKYFLIKNDDDLIEKVKILGYPCVLKKCCLGYDGKGQQVIKSSADLSNASELLCDECILEEYIDYDYESSSLVIRERNGNVVVFPTPINAHRNNILMSSKLIAEHSLSAMIKLESIKLIENSNLYGILAVEFFIKGNKVYFNEMAPRPHNSFHGTIEGCNYSQFDGLIKFLTHEELGKVGISTPTTMINVLGQHINKARQYLETEKHQAVYHNYSKKENKNNRKMAHITFYNDDLNELEIQANNFIKEVYDE